MKFINESRCCHTSYKEVKVPEICNLKNCICDGVWIMKTETQSFIRWVLELTNQEYKGRIEKLRLCCNSLDMDLGGWMRKCQNKEMEKLRLLLLWMLIH